MSARPQKTAAESRYQAQRERIMCAAYKCFVRQGFNAASMATIAETAKMSPGLIYRYFESKNEIILAIIERQLRVAQQKIRELHDVEDLANRMVEHFVEKDTDHNKSMSAPLLLEMSAEAVRDPSISAALERFDVSVRQELADWLRRSSNKGGCSLPDEVARERALILVCMVEGLRVRKCREPNLDRDVLRKSVEEMTQWLMQGTRQATS
jgi:AcrR family transcriptional regulator